MKKDGYHLIEWNGYDGHDWTEYETLEQLEKGIRESDAIDFFIIIGHQVRIDKSYLKKGAYWNNKKPVNIPELGLIIT